MALPAWPWGSVPFPLPPAVPVAAPAPAAPPTPPFPLAPERDTAVEAMAGRGAPATARLMRRSGGGGFRVEVGGEGSVR